jgi:FkbM family methyltransferase
MTELITITARNARWQLRAPDDHIGALLRKTGRPYEEDLLDAVAPLVSERDVVLDVGANLGNHTVYFAVARHAQVEAFEPNPDVIGYLRSNVTLNHLEASVRVHEAAAADTAGRGVIDNPRQSELVSATSAMLGTGTSRVIPDEQGTIRTVRLDDQNFPTVRLIKVDVEGAEESVLRGAWGLLQRDKPAVITESGDDAQRARIEHLLKPLGYRRFPVSFAYTPTWVYSARPLDFARLAFSRPVRQRLQGRLRARLGL